MANKSPLLNVIIQSLNKVTRKLLRDFGEIENLQLSPNSINEFVTKTEFKKPNNFLNYTIKEKKYFNRLELYQLKKNGT